MFSIVEVLAQAKAYHRAGQLQLAEPLYRQVLEADPAHGEACYLLGALCQAVGKLDEAADYLQRAVRLTPEEAQAHNYLGVVLAQQGKLDEAVACFQQAVRLSPGFVDAHKNLRNARAVENNRRAMALAEQQQLDEASPSQTRPRLHETASAPASSDRPTIDKLMAAALEYHQAKDLPHAEETYRRVLQADPRQADALHLLGVIAGQRGEYTVAVDYMRRAIAANRQAPPFHHNLAMAYRALGKLDEAAACLRQVIALKADDAETHHNLGNLLREQGRRDEAVECCRRAVEINPHFAEAHNTLGLLLNEQAKVPEAVASVQRALEIKPDYGEAHSNLGSIMHGQGRLDEAAASYRHAVQLRPDYAEAHNNLGSVRLEQGRFAEAAASFQQALSVRPDFAEAHLNLASLWLLQGDFARGWPEYAWRWKIRIAPRRNFAQPEWDGTSLHGQTILLHAEQGLGDAFQFIRYAPLVKQRGGTVLVECRKPSLPLLASCRGIDRLIAQGEPLPAFDCHAPLLSLPGIFQTGFDNMPADVPYLFAKAALVEHWQKALAPLAGVKVGIAWQGTPIYRLDRVRSIPLVHFAALAEIPGVHLISVQKVVGMEQLAGVADRLAVVDLGKDLDEASGPFMDTAAVMRNLDLVVTSDTATAHLAGALGVPVWVALCFVPSWRWLLQREDSPWYPTMRLFRQQRAGDWTSVFAEIGNTLCDRFALSRPNTRHTPGRETQPE